MLSLSFEAGRCLAGIAECVMFNPFPEISCEAENLVREKMLKLNLEETYEFVKELEVSIEKYANERISKILDFNGSFITKPFFFLTNRIISKGRIIISPELQFYITTQKNEARVEKNLKKIRKAEFKAIKSERAEKLSKINEIEGNILGYPQCCVKNFSKLKRLRNSGVKVDSPEGKIAKEFLEKKFDLKLDNIILNKNLKEIDNFYIFFAFNFYPCSIECKKAEDIGITYKNFLEDIKRLKLFYAGITTSAILISEICVKMKKIKGKSYHFKSLEENMKFLINLF